MVFRKMKIIFTTLIDKRGFGIQLFPMLYLGYEVRSLQKQIHINVAWLFFDLFIVFKIVDNL